MTNWQPNDPNAPQGGPPPQAPPPQAPPPQGPPAGQYGQQPAPDYGGYPAAPAASAYGPPPGALLPGATRPLQIGDRVVAYVIDFLIFLVLGIIFGVIAGATGSGALIVVMYLVFIVVGIYFIYLTGSTGQTPGKKIKNVKVADVNTGAVIGFWRAFGRSIIQGLLNYVVFAGLWSAFLDSSSGRYRGWHDKALSTQVISVG